VRSPKVRPDINVTPLVDVVLVLLIIFMVVTPQMHKGPTIEVPGVAHADPKKKVNDEPLTVKLDAKGVLYLDDIAVERSALVPRIKAELVTKPTRRVVLKADHSVRYGDLRAVFKEVQGAGVGGVGLEVGEKQAAGS